MTKIKTSMKTIKNGYKKVFRAGYCDLQFIFNNDYPVYYNSGVYGWNCDIYVDYKRDIAISTGYRNMIGDCIPSEILRKYSDIAKNILSWENKTDYKKKLELLEDNKQAFLNELDNL